MNPPLYILFLADKSMTKIMNICLGINVMIVFQVSLNFDPAKEILKI